VGIYGDDQPYRLYLISYCIFLYFVFYLIVSYSIVPYCIVLYYIVLHCIILYCLFCFTNLIRHKFESWFVELNIFYGLPCNTGDSTWVYTGMNYPIYCILYRIVFFVCFIFYWIVSYSIVF
jgi:hypothetical protein